MFCVEYFPYKESTKSADELKIKYNPLDPTLAGFLRCNDKKTIIIDVTDEGGLDDTDRRLFKGLNEQMTNFKLLIRLENTEDLNFVKENNIPFFFCNFATTIDQVYGLMRYSPTDMYICEELGFSLDKISAILHEKNIKVRVFPNICQSSFPGMPSLLKFFIRPDDIPVYEQFVDVFELVTDETRQDTIFKIYKQHKWFGDLNEIIPTFKNSLNSRFLLNDFGVFRAQCGKKCLYKPNSCNICSRLVELAYTFERNNIITIPQY